MKRTLNEKNILKKLDIPDFRHMSKDKIIKFVSLIPEMAPEVAMKAIEQFPEFAEKEVQLVNAMKDVLVDALERNEENQKNLYNSCNPIIETLKEELKVEGITFEERIQINSQLLELINLLAAKDTENKQFILNVVKNMCVGALGVGMWILAFFGASKRQITSNNYLDEGYTDNK